MAFIKEKERERLIKKVNQTYGFRKFWISITLAALIGFVVLVWLAFAEITPKAVENNKPTWFGWIMIVYALAVVAFGVVALILTFTIKSPKQVQAGINKLDTSAISGKKLKEYNSASSATKDRRTSKVDKVVKKYSNKKK